LLHFIPALVFSNMTLSISACVHHRAGRTTTQVAVS
jgi:Flp pilus assembly protein TadD